MITSTFLVDFNLAFRSLSNAGDTISQSNSSLRDRRKKNNTKSFPGFWMLANSWSTSKDNDGNDVITLIDDTVHGDVFAAGCLFFYYITRGLHPFDNVDGRGSIVNNIKNKNAANFNSINFTFKCKSKINHKIFQLILELKKGHFAYETIRKLIGDPPTDGTQLLQIAAQELGDLLPRWFHHFAHLHLIQK